MYCSAWVPAAVLDVGDAVGEGVQRDQAALLWNCGTAAGAVLKIRHGALPAVIAAPMTSSEVLPAGISWAVTFWSGCSAFQASTIALPQATSSGLLEYQIVMGPVVAVAGSEPESVPHPARAPAKPRTRAAESS